MAEFGVYKIQKGDSAYKIALKSLKDEGKTTSETAIRERMHQLAQKYGCENVEDFNTRYFGAGSVGKTIDTRTSQPKPQGNQKPPLDQELDEDYIQLKPQKAVSEMNSIDRIKQNIENAGGEAVEIPFSKLKSKEKVKVQSYLNLFKEADPTIIQDKKTGDVYVYLNTLNTFYGHKAKMQSMNMKLSDKETVVTRYYRNGKIAQDVENNFSGKSRSLLIQSQYKKQGAKKAIYKPLAIEIELNTPMYKNATPEQKKSIDKFVKAMENQKADLMRDLNIDNDTYNRFVKLAIGISMQESGLGTSDRYKYLDNNAIASTLKDSVAWANKQLLDKFGIKNPIKWKGLNATSVSKGLSQIKIGDWMETPKIKELFNKYGITSGYFENPTEEQSAAAAIIILNEINNIVKRPAFREGIEASNKKFYNTAKELDENGNVVEHKLRKWKLNTITEDDAILYYYNGRSGVLKSGNATPADNRYLLNIKQNTACVKVYENAKERAEALKNATEVVPDAGVTSNDKAMRDDLGWGIGQVAFMPKLYKSGIENNSEEEINLMQQSLTAKGVDVQDIESLAAKMRDGEIAFVKGLTKVELNSMTADDVKLLLDHSNRLSAKISTVKTDATKRKYASETDKNFKRTYLASHSQRVSLSGVKKNSVKLITSSGKAIMEYPSNGYCTGAQRRCKGLLPQLRQGRTPDAGYNRSQQRTKNGEYMGFTVEKDKGINTANASKIDLILAQNFADVANTLRTNGSCLTGAKQALIGAGVFKPEELRGFSEAFELAGFLRKHPDKFIEVTHIQVSPSQAREITAGDIPNLPAGCVVVYGNKNTTAVKGHSGGTSGNGQIYSDEIDNANWDNYTSSGNDDAKGEHGYFRVFRLNPAYFTVDESGKKVVKK